MSISRLFSCVFYLFVRRIGIFIISSPCRLIQGSFNLVKVAHVPGGCILGRKFLFLINGFVLDKTLSKSIFKSEKRNFLQIFFQIEKWNPLQIFFWIEKTETLSKSKNHHYYLFAGGGKLYFPYAQSIIKLISAGRTSSIVRFCNTIPIFLLTQ